MPVSKSKSQSKPFVGASGNPVALITGASSGIGEALAHCFAKAKHDVILVARNEDKSRALASNLHAQHGIQAQALPADLAQSDSVVKITKLLQKQECVPDVLVNCAGVLEQRNFVQIEPAAHQAMIDLNIAALTAMLSHLLPTMVLRGSGRVLNVASVAAFQPIPLLATYAASKAYVLSLTEALSEELRGTGVTATALCPGITATNMLQSAKQNNQSLSELPSFVIGDVSEVAQQGFDACMQGKVICVPGTVNQIANLASRSTPRALLRRVTGLIASSKYGGG
jgi:short-subunit dehydrogenase